jgi:hypothetical protein
MGLLQRLIWRLIRAYWRWEIRQGIDPDHLPQRFTSHRRQ